MNSKRLSDMSYGEFQERLVQLTMKEIDDKAISPLVYFPLVLDRVDSFLLAHWSLIWMKCSQMNWEQWLQSNCFSLFKEEVIKDIEVEILQIEDSKSNVS
ncbi:hypothetical protein J2S74_001587 [Evansella vedderi]|uniref:Uncharacterized protein n=1 Tax=Evansella vedderi TaxID=38282 RepID=A0ABT9ZSL0_9BACI|nr:hypothetical protein [Evansella vedderi]MDQ0254212.1 hypothetical protein [Evansella vedderi]